MKKKIKKLGKNVGKKASGIGTQGENHQSHDVSNVMAEPIAQTESGEDHRLVDVLAGGWRVVTIPITKIECVQMREEINQATVEDYTKEMGRGVVFTKPRGFYDKARDIVILGDGGHRFLGRRGAGHSEMECEVRDGTHRDAWLYAIGANSDHGLPRTAQDKRKAVTALLYDDEFIKLPAESISKAAKVSSTLVDTVISELTAAGPEWAKRRADAYENRRGRKSTPKKECEESESVAVEPIWTSGTENTPSAEGAPHDDPQTQMGEPVDTNSRRGNSVDGSVPPAQPKAHESKSGAELPLRPALVFAGDLGESELKQMKLKGPCLAFVVHPGPMDAAELLRKTQQAIDRHLDQYGGPT